MNKEQVELIVTFQIKEKRKENCSTENNFEKA